MVLNPGNVIFLLIVIAFILLMPTALDHLFPNMSTPVAIILVILIFVAAAFMIMRGIQPSYTGIPID